METIEYLLTIDLNYVVFVLIAVFFTLEQVLNTQFFFKNRLGHLGQAILFQVVFFVLNLFWAAIFVFCVDWLNQNQIGLFYEIAIPVWFKLILGVACIDLMVYWYHRMSHTFPLVWKFHRVHHSDTTMDSSTYLRAHPFEVIFWFGSASLLAVVIFGLDMQTVGLYFLIVTLFQIAEHANLRYPAWLDRTFGLVFTTPNQHKIHHDQDQQYTDSNYADIFILWDRIFGTYKYKPVEQVKLGLKEFEDPHKQTFWYLIISPFVKNKSIE